jgi:HemY protein
VLAARLSTRVGDVRRATRIIESTWKLIPHPDLAAAYSAVRPGDSAQDRLKRMQRLAGLQGGHREGKLALARAAIDARTWPEARQALVDLIAEPTERVCLLMAEIEQGQHGDRGRVRDWLARAVRAPRDPAWMADGEVFEEWAPISPVSGRLDAFEWKVPAARIGGPVLADIEAVAEPEPAFIGPPPAPPQRPAAQPVPLRPRVAETAERPSPRSRPVAANPATGIAPARSAAAPHPITAPARPPDDPGPDANGDEHKVYRRGR